MAVEVSSTLWLTKLGLILEKSCSDKDQSLALVVGLGLMPKNYTCWPVTKLQHQVIVPFPLDYLSFCVPIFYANENK